ncbi:MAG TPA: hypothetical protein VJK02_08465 [Anaerolineales bacterium]|nr:hypothetical protein [Anaerolineales bacterium]
MKSPGQSSRLQHGFWVLYTLLLPFIWAILLLGVSSVISRKPIMGSWTLDTIVRILTTTALAAQHAVVPNRTSLRRWFYGRDLENPLPRDDLAANIFAVFQAVVAGVVCAVVVFVVIQLFLPQLDSIAYLLAGLNGLVFTLPLLIQRDRGIP